MAGKSRGTKITKQFRYGRRRKPRRRGGDHRSAHREWVGRRLSVGDPTDRHRRGWLASPEERKLQNNFDTGAGESRGDGVETTAPLTASGWAGAGLSVTQPTDTDGDGWQVPRNENYKTISTPEGNDSGGQHRRPACRRRRRPIASSARPTRCSSSPTGERLSHRSHQPAP